MSVSTASNSNIYKIISDAAGLVGIGTASPGSYNSYANALVISGSDVGLTIASGVANYGSIHFADGTAGNTSYRGQIVYNHTNDSMVLNTASTERLRIDSSGNVGIGTTSPSYKLHLAGETIQWPNSILISPSTHATSRRASMALDNWYLMQDGQGIGVKDFGLYDGSTGIFRIFVNTSGYVGIGTTSPTANLSVNSAAADVYIDRPVNTADGSLILRGGPTTATSGMFIARGSGGTFNVGGVEIYTNGVERMRVKSDGYVGIGTTSPTASLTVAGDVHLSPTSGNSQIVIAAPTTGTSANIRWDTVFGNQKWRMTNTDSTLSYRFYFIDANDNDGVYMAQNATTWTSNSDSRLKDVKETITNALDKVNQLTGVKYTWKRDADNPDAKTRVGLIAQDVLAVLPEAVDDDTPELVTDEETGKVSGGLGVRYTELVPLLVNAIKELTTRIATLEQRA